MLVSEVRGVIVYWNWFLFNRTNSSKLCNKTTTRRLDIFLTVNIKDNGDSIFWDSEINWSNSSSLTAKKSDYFFKFKDQTYVRNWFLGFNIFNGSALVGIVLFLFRSMYVVILSYILDTSIFFSSIGSLLWRWSLTIVHG